MPLPSLVGDGAVAQVGLDVVLASAPPSLLQFSRSPGSWRRWRTWPSARASRWTPCASDYWWAWFRRPNAAAASPPKKTGAASWTPPPSS